MVGLNRDQAVQVSRLSSSVQVKLWYLLTMRVLYIHSTLEMFQV